MATASSVGGGGTLSVLYSSAKMALLRAHDGIERLERLESAVTTSSASASMDCMGLAAAVRRDISQVQSLCSDVDGLWRSIAGKSQRDIWRRFCTFLDSILCSIRRSCFLSGRYWRAGLRNYTTIFLASLYSSFLKIFDEEARAMSSVRNSKRMLEESYSTGVFRTKRPLEEGTTEGSRRSEHGGAIQLGTETHRETQLHRHMDQIRRYDRCPPHPVPLHEMDSLERHIHGFSGFTFIHRYTQNDPILV